MATSSKVQFNLETLKQKALESIDFRIAEARLHVDSFDDDEALDARVKTWREEQIGKILTMYSRVIGPESEQPSDHTLAKWKLDPMPEVDKYDRSRAESALRALEAKRSKIVAKSESLVPDDAGNISLTKTQLDEFFGL